MEHQRTTSAYYPLRGLLQAGTSENVLARLPGSQPGSRHSLTRRAVGAEQAMREAFTGLHAANGQRIRAQSARRFRVLPG
jgi:hypothetical protein